MFDLTWRGPLATAQICFASLQTSRLISLWPAKCGCFRATCPMAVKDTPKAVGNGFGLEHTRLGHLLRRRWLARAHGASARASQPEAFLDGRFATPPDWIRSLSTPYTLARPRRRVAPNPKALPGPDLGPTCEPSPGSWLARPRTRCVGWHGPEHRQKWCCPKPKVWGPAQRQDAEAAQTQVNLQLRTVGDCGR